MRDAWKGLKTLGGQTKPELNTSNKLGDKQKDHSNERNELYSRFDTQDFRTEVDQIRSEPQKVADDAEDFEIDAKIVECIFLKLKHWECNWSWQQLWKTFEIVRFPAFCCFQSIFHVVSEKKHSTFYLENLCNLSCTEKKEEVPLV